MPETRLKNSQLPTTLQNKTIDNSNDITTTTTKLKVSGGTTGQVLSTDGSGNLSWITVAGSDIDLGTFYDFGTFADPANYNIDFGAI